ncbi:hypothetical protein DVK44_26240 [Streptomyces paludis]|uniref:Lipoprotein n=1 Tax=Streptomyces paludis TaxID=2282738 RepID=A0A345I1T7_9ACTN|nr:hypothetical protein [Streptomyces paludis]AXG82911.1 hypothetical protein DVK44_26240 [Streptomyces paludis]
MGRTGTTRRHALMAAGATAAGLLTACTSGGSSDGVLSPDAAARAARAARALRKRAAGDSEELLRRYDAVLARHPRRTELLTPLRAAVARHVSALTLRTGEPSPDSSSDADPDTDTGGNTDKVPEKPSATLAGASAVSSDPAEALKELAAAERRTSDAHTASLVTAAPELARLLASLAAANAAHAYLLTEGARS